MKTVATSPPKKPPQRKPGKVANKPNGPGVSMQEGQAVQKLPQRQPLILLNHDVVEQGEQHVSAADKDQADPKIDPCK